MIKITSYLTFNGNCRKAMHFYKRCLGGTLELQTVGDTVVAKDLPAGMKSFILKASLSFGNAAIIATDMVPDEGLLLGNNISLLLECKSLNEMSALYERLANGGVASQQLIPTFWGDYYGTLTDKFGIHWLLNFSAGNKHTDESVN